MGFYILDNDGEPVLETDMMRWAVWFETAERCVKNEVIGNSTISTVFLGVDHNFCNSGGPVLWETMVFGEFLDEDQDRCAGNRAQAMAMHNRMVERVKQLDLTATSTVV